MIRRVAAGWAAILGCVAVSGVPVVNVQKCDASTSMEKGCHLHDFDGEWRTHECAAPKELWLGQCFDPCLPG